MNAPEDALAILAEHEDISYNLGTPREYTQHGGWNKSCGCGEHLCSHPDDCDCHRAHVAQVLTEWVAGEKAQAWDEGAENIRQADPTWWARIIRDYNPYRKDQEADAAARYLDRLERSSPSPEVQTVIDRLREEANRD